MIAGEEGLGLRCKYFLALRPFFASQMQLHPTRAGLKWAAGEAPLADFLIGLGAEISRR